MASDHNDAPRTYGGWQLERVAFLLGLTGQRTALLGIAIFLATQPVASGHFGAVIVNWPLALLLCASVFVRVAGRTVDEWVISVTSFHLLRLMRKNSFIAGAFASGHGTEPARMDLPGVLAPLRLLTAGPGTPREVAVVHHPHARTYTAVALVDHAGLGLVDPSRQNGAVDRWAGVLASLCSNGGWK